jgi:glycosyltransferase involved in cell wall biosynthesis
LLQQLSGTADRACELAVVGDVPPALKEKIKSSGVPVAWTGVVERTQIPAIDRSAHLLFSGDVNAACPNAVIEAMACGLPVIAYDTGALPELVSAEAGCIAAYGGDVWKLDPPDIPALTAAAWQVLQAQQEFSRGARLRAEENFDIEKIAAIYLEVLLGD